MFKLDFLFICVGFGLIFVLYNAIMNDRTRNPLFDYDYNQVLKCLNFRADGVEFLEVWHFEVTTSSSCIESKIKLTILG